MVPLSSLTREVSVLPEFKMHFYEAVVGIRHDISRMKEV
jgi:hypothetical protein